MTQQPKETCQRTSRGPMLLTKSCFFSVIEKPTHPCFPNPCGFNAKCNMHSTSEHASTCVCIKGYFGDPFSFCQKPECNLNKNCPADRVCRNQFCVNPCPGLCGTNAVCSISKHLPNCDCLQGYTGNPLVSCKLSKIFFDIVSPIIKLNTNEKLL